MTRVALVTGAGRGIGAAVSSLLGDRGWRVVGVDREWPGGEPDAALTLDLAEPRELEEHLGSLDRIDGLVNNAAVSHGRSLADTDDIAWARVLDVNLTAAFRLVRGCAPLLAASGGAVVNISSVHALATSPGNAAYASAKAALTGFTRSAAVELGPQGIRVNAVLPGAVDTDMLLPGTDPSERDQQVAELAARTPLRRIGLPAEIAEAVIFLLDNERSAFVTGQSLIVDGGALAHLATE